MYKYFKHVLLAAIVVSCVFGLNILIPKTTSADSSTCSIIEVLITAGVISPDKATAARVAFGCPAPVTSPLGPDSCPSVTVDGINYSLRPCSITESMIDGQGNKDFSTSIIQSGPNTPTWFGYSRYGYGEGFPTYSILGASSGGAFGTTSLGFYFNDAYLSAGNQSEQTYTGYLPIHVYHGSETGFDNNFLNLQLSLKVKKEQVTEPVVTLVSVDEEKYDNDNSADSGVFTIKYKVTASGGDIYLATSTKSLNYVVQNSGATSTDATISAVVVNNTDTDLSQFGNWLIEEGNSENITLTVSVLPSKSGLYRTVLSGIRWGDSDGQTNNFKSLNTSNFATDYLSLDVPTVGISSVNILSPNGGESYLPGVMMYIRLSLNNPNNLRQTLSLVSADSNSNLSIVRTISDSFSGNYLSWKVPTDLVAGNNYKIKATVGDVSDISDGYFKIHPAPVAVTPTPPSITSVAAMAASNNEIDAGGKFGIQGNNLQSIGSKDTIVYLNGTSAGGDKETFYATITQISNTLIYATAPSNLIAGSYYDLFVANGYGTSDPVKVKVLSVINPISMTGSWACTTTVTATGKTYTRTSNIDIQKEQTYAGSSSDGFTISGVLNGNAVSETWTKTGYTATANGKVTIGSVVSTILGTWKDSNNVSGTYTCKRSATVSDSGESAFATVLLAPFRAIGSLFR